jgi:hypothetical protein
MDPVSLNVIAYYPNPNTNVGPFLRNNFFVNAAETNTPNGTVWKLDHNFGSRHKLTFNGRFSSGLDGAAPIFENVANPGAPRRNVRSRSGSFSETFNISRRSSISSVSRLATALWRQIHLWLIPPRTTQATWALAVCSPERFRV